MRAGISVSLLAADRRRLQAIVADPKCRQKHVLRARIVLLTVDGIGTSGIITVTAKSKTCVWRWRERFMEADVDGLLSDRTRPAGKVPIAQDRVAEVVRQLGADAIRSDPLDGQGDGEGCRNGRLHGSRHLEKAWPCAAPLAQLQAVR
jgi:hypothetical protein